MRLFSFVLVGLSLVALSFSAEADDRPDRLPSVPTLTPDEQPTDAEEVPSPGLIIEPGLPGTGGIVQRWGALPYSSTIDQFPSSSYWSPPVPFAPALAHDYAAGPARGFGTHVRYPYFKYRAPWIYQGPAAISHTIHW